MSTRLIASLSPTSIAEKSCSSSALSASSAFSIEPRSLVRSCASAWVGSLPTASSCVSAARRSERAQEQARRDRVALVGYAVDERGKRRLRRAELAELERDGHVAFRELVGVAGGSLLRHDAVADGDRERDERDGEADEDAGGDAPSRAGAFALVRRAASRLPGARAGRSSFGLAGSAHARVMTAFGQIPKFRAAGGPAVVTRGAEGAPRSRSRYL